MKTENRPEKDRDIAIIKSDNGKELNIIYADDEVIYIEEIIKGSSRSNLISKIRR